MKRNLVLILLIIVVALGGALRLTHLNDASLWLDEGVTYYNSSGESYGEVWDKVGRLDQSPPGYYLITHNYLEIFGENEFGFRLISVIFGILSILFLYLLLGALFDEEVGLIGAALLAFHPFHIGFSMEARMYVMLSLVALMGFYFLYKAVTGEGRGYAWWLLFTVSSISGLYTHNFYIFVLAAFGVMFTIFLVPAEKKFAVFLMGLLSLIVTVIAYIPWLPSFLRQLEVERYWMADIEFMELKNYLIDFSVKNDYLMWGFSALCLIGVAHVLFSYRQLDYKKQIVSLVSLGIFVLIGLGVPFVYSLVFEPIVKIRYIVYILPIFLGFVALGIYALRRFSIIFPIIILSIFIYFATPWETSEYPVEFREDYRGFMNIVNAAPAPIVAHSPSIKHVMSFYNQNRVNIRPFPYSDDLKEFSITEESKGKFLDLIKDFDSFYLVVTHSHEEPGGLLYIWSDAECDDHAEISADGMEAWYFEGCGF